MNPDVDSSLDDPTQVWSLAANCSLYEEDAGPSVLNIASTREPYWVSRSEAFRDLYAHLLLEHVGANPARISVP